MKPATIRRHLRKLRAECIVGTDDVILRRIAYEMEVAIRRVMEPVVGCGSLADQAKEAARALRYELQQQAEMTAHNSIAQSRSR